VRLEGRKSAMEELRVAADELDGDKGAGRENIDASRWIVRTSTGSRKCTTSSLTCKSNTLPMRRPTAVAARDLFTNIFREIVNEKQPIEKTIR
jgi:hypothetical protein